LDGLLGRIYQKFLIQGCFPATYGIRTKGNDGNLDYKITPLAHIMVAIVSLSVLFTKSVIVGVAIFLISALTDIGFYALGFGSLAFFESRAWCMLLSRMTECKRS